MEFSSEEPRSNPHQITLESAFELTFHQKYSFDDFLNLDIGKEVHRFDIRGRPIFSPSKKLKKYHRFLNTFIFDYADIAEEVVHSYRKGKSPYTALAPHAQNKFFFKTDINNFFYSFSLEQLENFIDEHIKNTPISDINKYRSEILDLISVDGLLPVGFGSSPNITNSLLFQFDNELSKRSKKYEVVYTRYCDDIILSSRSRKFLKYLSENVEPLLKQCLGKKFELNTKKTKFTHVGNRVKLLGMVIAPSGKVTVDSKTKKEMEVLLYFYTEKKESYRDYLISKFENNLAKASGRLNYINTIDPEFVNKLRIKYGNFVVDYFLGGAEN